MRIAIIGGGISGLATAYRLSQSQLAKEGKLEIHLYEASDRFGGVIQSEKQNGFLMEKGPDAFISAKPGALELCQELGLSPEFLQTNPNYRTSFILSNNKLVPMPQGFYLMAPTKVREAIKTPLLTIAGKIRMACELFIPKKKLPGDESLASFVRRRFGKELLDRIAQPMIAGIYSADPERLSLEATFPNFLKMEQDSGSVIRGMAKQHDAATRSASGPRYSLFLSLREGMGDLISKLIEQMPDVSFHIKKKTQGIEKAGGWKIRFSDGEIIETDLLCLAVPAPVCARILKGVDPALTENLRRIPYANVATLNLGFARRDIQYPFNGIGYVVPAIEKKKIMGCTFSSVKFTGRAEDQETILLRAFIGGHSSRQLLAKPDEKIVKEVLQELKDLLGISAEPIHQMFSRWEESIPQYHVGHRETVSHIFTALEKHPGLYLTGNAYDGTGIPDCITHASKTAARILAEVSETLLTAPR